MTRTRRRQDMELDYHFFHDVGYKAFRVTKLTDVLRGMTTNEEVPPCVDTVDALCQAIHDMADDIYGDMSDAEMEVYRPESDEEKAASAEPATP